MSCGFLNLFVLAPRCICWPRNAEVLQGEGGAVGTVRDDGIRKSRWRFFSSVSMGYV